MKVSLLNRILNPFLIVCLTLSGCLVDPRLADNAGVTLECTGNDCPTDERIVYALERFADIYHFDTTHTLLIQWYPQGFPDSPTTTGWTHSERHIQVVSWSALAHELVHVYFLREEKQADYNHAEPGLFDGDTRPTLWTKIDDCLIESREIKWAMILGNTTDNLDVNSASDCTARQKMSWIETVKQSSEQSLTGATDSGDH